MQYLRLILLILLTYSNLFAFDVIVPGLHYKHLTLKNSAQSIHLLVADPHKVNIKIGIAHNKCASAEKTSEISKNQKALAAINGGYFDFGCKNKIQDTIIKVLDCLGYSRYKAFPMWTLCKDQRYYAVSHNFTGAMCWNNSDQAPLFYAIKTVLSLYINNVAYQVTEFNKPNPKGPTLYSSCYDKITPSFHEPVDEIMIQDDHIVQIYRSSHGKNKIPSNGWVYVIPQNHAKEMIPVDLGDRVVVTFSNMQKPDLIPELPDSAWNKMDNIVAATPLLLCNGAIPPYLNDYTSDFYTKRHPRSAVGVCKNGNWVFLVVDGRAKHSEGFTILELAQFMKTLGCVGALNLDGGGSSTMVVQDKVVNSPSGREHALVRKERPVSNAFLICLK
ncbi:MAG TPA: phosphodiester glycosidase family protein [Candidatus Babeliales bacterium]|nr:phosphodiester glycosidase family protein [Candidatus Babeliales bacterium]